MIGIFASERRSSGALSNQTDTGAVCQINRRDRTNDIGSILRRLKKRKFAGSLQCPLGSKADTTLSNCDVRFTTESGHLSVATRCPLVRSAAHPGITITGSVRAIAPLPFQCSPFSSSRAKQLGWRRWDVCGVPGVFSGHRPPRPSEAL